MNTESIRTGGRWLATGVGLAAGAYAAYAAVTWLRYGKAVGEPAPEDADELLDRFMPDYEVVERHHIHIAAPAAIALTAGKDLDVMGSALARCLFKTRALVLGGQTDQRALPHALAEQAQAIGWRVLAEVPGHELVFGAVTKPWLADPVFRGVAPSDFLAFNEADYVKIVWTLRADPINEDESLFRMETRVCTTDAAARSKFRRYWAFASPGVALLRRVMLAPVKCEAERRAKKARSDEPAGELRAVV
jgi:hypothetical protein